MTAALLILALLVGGFVERMVRVFAWTERRFVETTVININAALQVRAALAEMNNDTALLRRLVEGSPMQVASELPPMDRLDPGGEGTYLDAISSGSFSMPANYLGELQQVDPIEVPGGWWYFDTSSRMLVYRINNDELYSGSPLLGYRVKVEYADTDGDGRYEPGTDRLRSLSLEAMSEGHWRL